MNKLNLNSEKKCGYLIDENMKKVWQTELDILSEIINICKKHNLKYFGTGGTSLGAVRHKGFIPWDDDIDLVMKREDYEKFINIAPKEIKENFFVQCSKTEKKYFRGHMQVRNSNTTAIISDDKYNDYNKGIWVDIFPLDNVPDDLKEREKFIKKIAKKRKLLELSTYKKSNNILKAIIKWFIANVYWKIKDVDEEIKKFEEFSQKYNNTETKQCGAIMFAPFEFKYDNDWCLGNDFLDFEYMQLSVFKDYKAHLVRQYGDNYMEIPKNKGGSKHGKVFFDVNKSYKTYSKSEIDKIINELEKE